MSASPSRHEPSGGDGTLGKGELRVLTAIAQYPAGVERDQITVLTGYKRSSRDTYIQRLSSAGLVDTVTGLNIRVTSEGIAALGADFEPLPTGAALLEYWRGRLPEGERKVLEVLVAADGDVVDREVISDQTGYKRSSRDTYLQRLRSRRLIEVERHGIRASENLFG